MGVTFDRWLAKPSTLCFLRRVIQSETKPAIRHGGYRQARRQHNETTAAAQDEKAPRAAEDETTCPQRSTLSSERRAAGCMQRLYTPFGSGAPLLGSGTIAKDASSEVDTEIDVGSLERLGQLMVDNPEYTHDLALWAEILLMRQRLHGREGVEAVWAGMRHRNVDLPTTGESADLFWSTFIIAAIDRRDPGEAVGVALTLKGIFSHAKDLREQTGQQYRGLYKMIVGRSVRVAPSVARVWHTVLVQHGFASPDDIVDTIPDLLQDTEPAMLAKQHRVFRKMYEDARRRDLYDQIIAQALMFAPKRTALHFHQTLISQGDSPSQEFFETPGVQWLFEMDQDRSLPMVTKMSSKSAAGPNSQVDLPRRSVNREAMNAIVGEVHGIKPKEISDAFCARMFATRAFSIEWIIKGLALCGVENLGPLALREMAVRAGTLENFQSNLALLESIEMACDGSMFSQMLRKIAKDGNSRLFQALLQNDQHPEAFDDVHAQLSVLEYSLEQENWAQVQVGLLVATLSGGHFSGKAWNRVLRHYLPKRDFATVARTVQRMKSQQIPLSVHTLVLLRSFILPPRDRSKRPFKSHGPGIFEPTTFVAQAYIYAVEHGTYPQAWHWVEILKRLGMDHQWKQLEQVVLTLLKWSTRAQGDEDVVEDKDVDSKRLQAVFTPNMCKALFVWGFRSASVRKLLRPSVMHGHDQPLADHHVSPRRRMIVEPWARGLRLLQRLRDAGFDVVMEDVRDAFVQRMWILFGPGFSFRAINHEARRVNRLSLAHYIKHANEAWPGLVDWVKPELLEREDDVRLLPAFFSEWQSTMIRRNEVANVKAWAEALASGTEFTVEPKRIRHKKALWMHSPLRLVRSSPGGSRSPAELRPHRETSGPGKQQVAEEG